MIRSPRVVALVLAGGEGRRLSPLTSDRAKPAVPFGGHYRIIDFALSNLINAGFVRIFVLTQYKSHSLNRHIAQTWGHLSLPGHYVVPVPAQMREGRHWFAGSADAIFQSLHLLEEQRPEHVLVFGADHIYRMDPAQMLDRHIASGADLTVAATRVPIQQASAFGVFDVDASGAIRSFAEKPSHSEGLSGSPTEVFASMGNYCFSTQALIEAVRLDALDISSAHDVGGSIIPKMVQNNHSCVYDFADNEVPGATELDRAYWRDVGTLDSYYEASMDLVAVQPIFNLYNEEWPIHCWHDPSPPAKFVFDEANRKGQALDSIISAGAIVSGGTVRRSILCPRVRVESGALVEGSVLMDRVRVGEGAIILNCIIDKGVDIPRGARLGCEPRSTEDRFLRTAGGVTVIGKGEKVLPTHC